MPPLPLSISIIALNEEANLRRCLEAVKDLAAEIVILDSGSKDATQRIPTRLKKSRPYRRSASISSSNFCATSRSVGFGCVALQ